jgi:hypothetical protein
MDNAEISTTCIHLRNEGVDVWRPTKAARISKTTFRVLATEDCDSEIEDWEFKPGSLVECREEEKSQGVDPHAVLIAFRAVESPSQ